MSAPNSISVASAGFQAFSTRQLMMAMVYLLNQLNGAMTPNQLAKAAACFNCFDERYLLVVQTYLLSQLAGSGGVPQGNVMQYTAANPTAQGLVPNNPNAPALAYPAASGGITYTWNTTTLSWQ